MNIINDQDRLDQMFPRSNRRLAGRVAVKDAIYVVVHSRPQMMGQMVDISPSGLSFTFVDLEASSGRIMDQPSMTLDLFAGGQGYFTKQLSCQVRSKIDAGEAHDFSALLIKRVGVQFEDLTIRQQAQINELVRFQQQEIKR